LIFSLSSSPMSLYRGFSAGLWTLSHTAPRSSSSERYQATYTLVQCALAGGDSPEQIRSDFLFWARTLEPWPDSYGYETAVAVIQRAINAAIDEGPALPEPWIPPFQPRPNPAPP
jgi:hypothetical protein